MTKWHTFTISMFPLFYKIFHTLLKIFSGRNLWGHLSAIALTFILVTTGSDWWYFVHFHGSGVADLLFPAVWLGMLVPVLLPVMLLVWGYVSRQFRTVNAGWALGQAALLGWLVSSFYKAFTGRPGPPFHRHGPLTDVSHVFRFGFWRGGIFWGWPSSHTAVAFAMAFTLVALFPRNKWIRYLAPLYALYIGAGVSVSIHWFSDFIAGAILGFITGSVAGAAFYQRQRNR